MEIRAARESDVRALLDIINYEAEHSSATFLLRKRTLEERTEWFHEHGSKTRPLIVAEEDGQTVGYASLSQYRENDAYAATAELSIYIHHDCRGQGIGEALMKEILRIAKVESGIHAVISVITAGNEASVRLHKKYGFTYCGTLKETGEKFGRWLDVDFYELLV